MFHQPFSAITAADGIGTSARKAQIANAFGVDVRTDALFQQGDKTRAARKEILIEERAKLLERIAQMQETLDKLNYKIDNYYKCVEFEDTKLK